MAPAWRTTGDLTIAELSGKGLWSVQDSCMHQQWLKECPCFPQGLDWIHGQEHGSQNVVNALG